jgi:hypothetical protein
MFRPTWPSSSVGCFIFICLKESASLLFSAFFTWSHSACFHLCFVLALFSFVNFVVSLRVCLSACSFFVVCLFCLHADGTITCTTHWTIQCIRRLKYSIKSLVVWNPNYLQTYSCFLFSACPVTRPLFVVYTTHILIACLTLTSTVRWPPRPSLLPRWLPAARLLLLPAACCWHILSCIHIRYSIHHFLKCCIRYIAYPNYMNIKHL